MKHRFDIPDTKKIRLIIDTDAKNEADDQFAIVHALLTPRFIVKGIIAAHFGTQRTAKSMQESYEECVKILELMDLTSEVKVYHGAEAKIPDEHTPMPSESADLIIREAMSDSDKPLYVIFLGPLTDLASAYLKEPAIENRLTAIWIGGGAWPNGEREFNLGNDIDAANVVMRSNIPLWQVPRNVYTTMRVSLAVKVKPYGKIGEYLFRQLYDLNFKLKDNMRFPKGEMWSLGDSPAVSLLLDPHEYHYEMKPAPRITPDMRYVHYQNERFIGVYNYVDPRFTLEDFFAKLKLHYGE
ncbi:hypothetical protein Cst_c23330 [Thermoclostridium stercorarium subsp. stercorarium DSM 8532]|uniref:Inosine/uridine-preferring nucleoside hydrolase domain-containing protein n=1 Tax=Thermoclostridium stercorarium (strain ATCC 35414 / DSM 8532 / NCIMB 11754) TaxID=1121335 RepID=L7VUM7_THES1|nr:nucleoside hydrolase [Thermoclostridium stercorarium]AGC69293.1 hypothetical protein Cst_c23330 [Thermoclostridium stercorarium subsp. stercorarium DSM 8532]AGI40257.1 Inosine-uridine nucleoside N-ribohydrolase [Thermoclostridium stercorarium subsp. stercorarium DSM 8532]